MSKPLYKMGIDVGGTFTHAVIVATPGPQLITSQRTPTTHRHPNGVAEGIIQAARLALEHSGLNPADISLIAHSTTQATNALLEGDVAAVGILAMGGGVLGQKVKADTQLGDVPLGKDHAVKTHHHFLPQDEPAEADLRQAIESLIAQGARALVAAQAYSVDNPAVEEQVVTLALEMGLPATATHHVSSLYGLKARLRTAVINAAILPVMTSTAELTARALAESGLSAPLMVVRSDGGMMSLAEMRRRPILTLLSGPAAGVAAAVKFSRLSQAVFMEVGGTSTDMSVILGGRARLKTARVGGHRLHLKTVDVTTEGLAGGSLYSLENNQPVEVGPRSAHIAGLGYASFTQALAPLTFAPQHDPRHKGHDYLAVVDLKEQLITLTPTCVASALGRISPGTPASATASTLTEVVAVAAQALGQTPALLLENLDTLSRRKTAGFVTTLLKEQNLDKSRLVLAWGGGGAYAYTGAVAADLGMKEELVPHAEVISAIGAALAAVKETVERNIPQPTEADLLGIRQEALQGAVRMGARPETVTVQVTVDTTQNLIRAEAVGSTDATQDTSQLDTPGVLKHVAPLLGFTPNTFEVVFENDSFVVALASEERKRFLGLGKTTRRVAVVAERTGVMRVMVENPVLEAATCGAIKTELQNLLEKQSHYGDAGQEAPAAWVLAAHKLIDLSAVGGLGAAVSLSAVETAELPPDTPCLMLIGKPV